MRTKSSCFNGFSLTGLCFTLASVFLLAACDSGTPSTEQNNEVPVRPAKLIEIGQTNSDVFLNYPAVIKSQQLTSLYFEVGGMLNELPVIQAQQVKRRPVSKIGSTRFAGKSSVGQSKI